MLKGLVLSRMASKLTSHYALHMKLRTCSFRYILKNSNGMQVRILSYGGVITSILVPDKHGQMADVTTGYDTLSGEPSQHLSIQSNKFKNL